MKQKRGSKEAPLVAASAQGWKVTFGIGAMVVAAVASILQLVGPPALKAPAIGLALGAGVVGIVVLLLVRCPRCGGALAVWAFRTGSLTTWHESLVQVTACPYCGHARTEPGAQK